MSDATRIAELEAENSSTHAEWTRDSTALRNRIAELEQHVAQLQYNLVDADFHTAKAMDETRRYREALERIAKHESPGEGGDYEARDMAADARTALGEEE